MADIFISYARADRPRAETLAAALHQTGWSVWWDREIPPGRSFDEVIEEALSQASCVVVIWSEASVRSEWVKTEAAEAAARRILVPILADSARIPLEFRRTQAAVIDAGFRDLGDDPSPEVVHDVRVATRRLRTALRSFSSLVDLDAEARTEVEEDLRWLAGLLSGVRDADILRQNLDQELAALPDELVMGPVREEIATTLSDERRAALADLAAEQDSPRYRQIRETVSHWLITPPLTDDAGQQIEDQGREILARRRRQARRRLATASVDPTQAHEARRAVKRLRYTADVLVPVTPGARKLAKRAKRLQRRLVHLFLRYTVHGSGHVRGDPRPMRDPAARAPRVAAQ